MLGTRLLFAFGYGWAAALGALQFYGLFVKIGKPYSGLFFYAGVAFFSGLGCFGLMRRATWADSFVKIWNWVFLASSLIAVWLGPSPDVRIPNLYLLGYATLVCSIY